MSSIVYDSNFYHREVAFCKVYSQESKEKMEKIFLKNRISYFIEWQEKPFFQRMKENSKEKNVFTIRINEADVDRARELVEGLESVKIRKTDQKDK